MTALIQGLVDEAGSFVAREYAGKSYIVSVPPGAVPELCENLDELIRRCRKGPCSLALHVLQVLSEMGLRFLIISWIGPEERAHWSLVFDGLGIVRWPIPEAGLDHLERLFGGCLHFPDWAFLSSPLMDPARN